MSSKEFKKLVYARNDDLRKHLKKYFDKNSKFSRKKFFNELKFDKDIEEFETSDLRYLSLRLKNIVNRFNPGMLQAASIALFGTFFALYPNVFSSDKSISGGNMIAIFVIAIGLYYILFRATRVEKIRSRAQIILDVAEFKIIEKERTVKLANKYRNINKKSSQ